MSDFVVEDLRRQIASGKAIAIVGAGVSVGATNRAPVASWLGLLEDGIERCEVAGHPSPPPGWADAMRALLELADTKSLLPVAEQISEYLGAPDGGRYGRWLRDCYEQLAPSDRSVLEALSAMGIPIATTNYDGLLEHVSGRRAATWRDVALVERALRGQADAILHLHGYWESPDTVVLGIRSYEDVIRNAHAQAVLRALPMERTCVFVGFGAGLGDPNFAALFRWMRSVFARSQLPHYRLVRVSELDGAQAQHAAEEQVIAFAYGEQHSDLAPFLRTFAPGGGTKGNGNSKPVSTVSLPPKPARCIGRDQEVEALVGAVLAGEPSPLLGSAGIGKSTVCLQALHDPRVVEHFGARRYFVRCDGAKTAEDLTAATAAVLGMEAGPALMGRITRELAEAPATMALDNLETPWEQEPFETEALLAEVAAVPGLALAVTLRGRSRPPGVSWRDPIEVQPLKGDDPKRLFLAVAGKKYESDPQLEKLLAALDGVPLALELMAHAAESEPDLRGVWERWQAERTRMLKRGRSDDRSADLAVSLELSINSPRMTNSAGRLLSLMGLLPDGVAHGDLEMLLPGSGNAAAAILRQLALAFDEAGRLRMLAPVREHVAEEHSPEPGDLQRAIAHYTQMALDLGPECGAEGGREAVIRLTAETANIESILIRGLNDANPARVMRAAVAFGQFQRSTGFGTVAFLEAARDTAKRRKDVQSEADCIVGLGVIAVARSNHEAGRAQFEEALPLYRRVGDLGGEVSCIKSLGDIALRRSDHDAAREHYQRALPFYRRVGDVVGEANCIRSLGDIALARSEHKVAREQYQEALPLYQQVGAVFGEANCIKSLGDIALRQSGHQAAREQYQKALPLYQQVGAVLGEANCIQGLGDIARACSDHDAARERYQEALPLYRRIVDLLGEANCITGLGYIALARSEHEAAREHFENALPLYQRVGDVLGEASCMRGLGDIALACSDHDAARERHQQALPLYQQVGSVLGEANCIKSLGDIALARSEHEAAREHYQKALPLYQQVGSVLGEAGCIAGLGDIALRCSEHEAAREHYQKALPLYRRVGHVGGEANCVAGLGDVALARSEHEAAREHYQKALPLYQRVGSVLGETNCIKSLGDIALARSEHEAAREYYKKALPLYQRIGDVLGEANCIKSLGDIALRQSDHEAAHEQYEAAVPLYRQVGDVLSEANCILHLGQITLARSEHEAAREHFENATPLYQRVGDVLGEANCMRGLADVARARSNHQEARRRYQEALRLYSRARDPYSIGVAHAMLAQLMRPAATRMRHVRAAREAWLSIKRDDLVGWLDETYGRRRDSGGA